jgi:hypothetical protein
MPAPYDLSFVPVRDGLTTCDYWFAALDQQVIQGPAAWRLDVIGIHQYGRDLWIQVAIPGDDNRTVVIHCRDLQPVADVMAAIRATPLDFSGSRLQIVQAVHFV